MNVSLYRKRVAEMSASDETGTVEQYLSLIGAVTTVFEECEGTLVHILSPLAKDYALFMALFSVINSRTTRNQLLEEFLESSRTRRPTKRFLATVELFKRYEALSRGRDEVAHARIMRWNFHGKKMIILEPGWYFERKRVGGLPKYHYDIPKLKKLVEDINQLKDDMMPILAHIVAQNTRRLMRSLQPAEERKSG